MDTAPIIYNINDIHRNYYFLNNKQIKNIMRINCQKNSIEFVIKNEIEYDKVIDEFS